MIDTTQDLIDEKNYYKELHSKQLKFTKRLLIVFIVIIVPLLYWNMALRNNNVMLTDELNCTKQKWCDFNSTYIPETALKRI